MIKLHNIRKSYSNGDHEVEVLRDISIQFNKGEFISILGPSGCGKSTLLNLLGGLDTPTSGNIIVNGDNVVTYSEKDWTTYRKNKVGFIFQSFNLIPHLTVVENVEIAMTLTGVPKKQRNEKAVELLKSVGLDQQINSDVKNLSGGQKQRVAIARALANDPDILLADEPTGALDTETSLQIMNILNELKNEGKTIIFVTHDKDLAMKSDRVVQMKDGIVISDNYQTKSKKVFNQQDKVDKSKSMSFKTSFKLAINNLKQKKWRTGLTAFGASIGIGGIAIMVGLGIGIQNKVESEVDKISDDRVISVSKADEKAFSTKEINNLKQLSNVSSVTPSYLFFSEIQFDDNSLTTSFSSLKPKSDNKQFEQNEITNGRLPSDNEKGIVLSKKNVRSLNTTVDKILNKNVEVNLQLSSDDGSFNNTVKENLKVVGISKDGPFGFEVAYLPEKLAEKYATASAGNENTTSLTVSVQSADQIKKVKKKIENLGHTASSDTEQLDKINDYFKMAQVGLGSLAGVSLIVSSIMIGIVLYISVLERTREIGILRAIGARKADIRRLFLSEAAVIGLSAGVIGVAGAYTVGTLGNLIVERMMKENAFEVFSLTVPLVVFCIVFSTSISVLAGVFPARKSVKGNTVDSLRYE